MILLVGKPSSAKSWQGLGKTGKVEAPETKLLAHGTSQVGLSHRAEDGREGFGVKGHLKGLKTPW